MDLQHVMLSNVVETPRSSDLPQTYLHVDCIVCSCSIYHTTLVSRMEFSFPPPSSFLALPVEPPVPWIRWHESIETYIAALGLEDLSGAWKKATLIHCLGTEGQTIFKTLGAPDTYEECVKLLSGHFATPQSVILRWILSESVHQYVADLRGKLLLLERYRMK